jgi:hypothetical protein
VNPATLGNASLTWTDWIGVVGVAVTILGFAVTLFQLRRTKTAAEAARTAATAAVEAVTRAQVLTTIQSLRRIEDELDAEVRASTANIEAVLRSLRDWRELASDVYPTVNADPDEGDIAKDLKQSIDLASTAKGQLVSGAGNVANTTEAFREQVSRVCNGLGLFANKLKTEIGGPT